MLTVYERSDLVNPIDDLPVTGLEPGVDSDTVELVARNETGSELRNVLLVWRTESPTVAGVAVAAGVPPQDERWARVAIVGVDATGEAGWSVPTTGVRSLGAHTGILIERIPDDCGVEIDVYLHPPGTAVAPNSWRFFLLGVGDEYSQPLAAGVGDVSRGILCGKVAGIIRGFGITATGTPDDEVHLAAGLAELEDGTLVGNITQDLTLDQNDGAAAALGSGESYEAAITIDASGNGVVTKGAKGVAPVRPTPPAGILRAWVHVDYGVSGSVIGAEDIEVVDAEGRHLAVADTGLFVKIYPGQSLTRTSWTYRADAVLVPVAASDTNYLWLLTSGLWESTVTDTPPEEDARCHWEADTDVSSVTALRDRRTYAGERLVLRLRGDVPGSPPETLETLGVEHDELVLEQVVGRVSDNGAGAADETILDVELDGTTIFTDSGTEDLRPQIAFDATDLRDAMAVHQVTVLRAGQELALIGAAYPDAGSSPPAWAEVQLVCRRPSR